MALSAGYNSENRESFGEQTDVLKSIAICD
jgi:hypothetical protein